MRGEILAKRQKGERLISDPVTLADGIERYFAQAKIRPSTEAVYRQCFNRPHLDRLRGRKLFQHHR